MESGGYSLIVECSLLIVVVASLIVEHGLRAFRLQEVRHTGSAVVAPGIFLDQGSHLCLLALAGRFCTTEPPEKPSPFLHFTNIKDSLDYKTGQQNTFH